MNSTEIEEKIYSRVGGWLALDFTNTVQTHTFDDPSYDYIRRFEDLTVWARQAELITPEQEEVLNRQAAKSPAKAQELLERARTLRKNINAVFAAAAAERQPDPEQLEALNHELGMAMSHSRIEHTEDGFVWGWSDYPDEMESVMWPVIRSAADLLVNHDKLERVRECDGDTCGWLFVDTSKNHSRRWCDMKDCGNNAKARRHYHRKTAGSK